jgi:ribose transport system substrate-binding protein
VFLFLAFYRRKRRVFLMIPAFSQKHWFAEFLQDLLRALDVHGYDLVLKIPTRDFSVQGQTLHFRSIRKRSTEFVGGFIIAVDPESIRRDLVDFCQHVDFPVIFVDMRPFTTIQDYPANAAFVGYSADEIGAHAARYVARYLSTHQIDNPLVLVVGSTTQSGRQQAFAHVLKEKVPNASVLLNNKGAFVRSRAREIVEMHLKESARRGRSFDIIFCTNDEMALGAVDAIRSADPRSQAQPLVLGVDGTDEALALIQSGGTPFQATLLQDSQRVAEVAVDLLLKKLAHEAVDVETLLATELYPMHDLIE